MTVSAACLAFGVSRRFYHRWLPRWRARGHAGLVDHGSRPRSSPQRLPSIDEARIVALRRSLGWGADRLGALLGLPASTCHRVLDRQGLIVRTREREPANRCEHEHPGDLLHLDTKKLGRIVGGPGHRATGHRRGRSATSAGRSSTSPSTMPPVSSMPRSCPTARRAWPCVGSSRTTAALIGVASSPAPCSASASSTLGPGPIDPARTGRSNAGSGRCCRSASISRSSGTGGNAGLHSIASSATTTGCALTWASVAGPRDSGSARSSPPDRVTNVAGDNT